jgi:far upstream element-binding protein
MSGGQFTEDFRIPDTLVGLVIGRGGEQIKRMQQDSGCKIRIASDSDGTSERTCTLSGSQESIDTAKRMLSDVVQRGQNREQGGGRGGQGGHGGGGYGQRDNNMGGGGGYGGGYDRR